MSGIEFKELLRRKPFIPLRIHMSDGQTYEIRHPEMVLVLRGRIDVGIGPDPNTGVLDRVEHCSLLHVVRIEELQSAPKSQNGPPAS